MFFDKWCCHQLAMSPTWSFHPDLWWWQQKCKLSWLINFTCQLDLVVKNSINPFYPIFYFYTPWKYQKTFRFLTFSGGIEIEHWPIIGKYYIYNARNKTGDHFSRQFWSKDFWFDCEMSHLRIWVGVIGNFDFKILLLFCAWL